ncbi:MAG: hypothetical protein JO112_14980 [Planctomycetes bacterium]|nr:hypothetical protein [Planctomycetota bacterium]
MAVAPRRTWLPRLLFRGTLLAAGVLLVLVVAAPWVDNPVAAPQGGMRLVAVFARDRTMRRTAVASALGLGVSACVFFRTPGSSRNRSTSSPKVPPPTDVVGA